MQVVELKGYIYHVESFEQFLSQLKASDNEYIKKLEQEIKDAISDLSNNVKPSLQITLDDLALYDNPKLFISMVNK